MLDIQKERVFSKVLLRSSNYFLELFNRIQSVKIG
jgi:hypothetical protein